MHHQPPASHDGVTSPVTNDTPVGPAARRGVLGKPHSSLAVARSIDGSRLRRILDIQRRTIAWGGNPWDRDKTGINRRLCDARRAAVCVSLEDVDAVAVAALTSSPRRCARHAKAAPAAAAQGAGNEALRTSSSCAHPTQRASMVRAEHLAEKLLAARCSRAESEATPSRSGRRQSGAPASIHSWISASSASLMQPGVPMVPRHGGFAKLGGIM
jgi:hypothetical protein